MARPKKPKARDAFEDNLADAEKLLEIVRAVENRRTYKMRRERQERVGEALDVGKKERGDLDWIEGDEVYLVFKPGAQLGRDSFTELEMRPFLRQAVVAACAAVETFAADRAKERLSLVLDMDPLPPRLRDLPIPLEDWFRIEETYKRKRWGLRPIIESSSGWRAGRRPRSAS